MDIRFHQLRWSLQAIKPTPHWMLSAANFPREYSESCLFIRRIWSQKKGLYIFLFIWQCFRNAMLLLCVRGFIILQHLRNTPVLYVCKVSIGNRRQKKHRKTILRGLNFTKTTLTATKATRGKNGWYPPTQNGHIRSLFICHDKVL